MYANKDFVVLGMRLFDSLKDLSQAVTPVDERCYLSGLHELVHDALLRD
jgi:hypothetical protein